MEKEIIASCQECEFEGVIEGDCCPNAGRLSMPIFRMLNTAA